jgi:hypothetical protein
MTRETLAKMPANIRAEIEDCRRSYKAEGFPQWHYDIARERSAAYVKGLRDAGLITERERQILFVYTTV